MYNISDNETLPFYNVCVEPLEYSRNVAKDKTTVLGIQLIFGLIYFIIFFLGVCGNGLVIVSVYRDKLLHSVRNTFIVSLSCSDIAVCLTSVLVTPIHTMAKKWLFGEVMCYVFPLFQGMSICISTFTLTAIAFDRYILIIHPTKSPISQLQATIIIIGIWVLGASVSIPVVVHSNYFSFEDEYENGTEPYPCGMYCGEKWVSDEGRQLYGTVVLVVQFVIPLLVVGYCYATICVRLRHGYTQKLINTQKAPLSERQQAMLKRKQRTNHMLISMVVIFASCWFLQVLFNVLNDYGITPEFISNQRYLYGLTFHVIAMTSTFWNPILYAGLNEGFRMAFIELLPCLGRAYGVTVPEQCTTTRQQRLLSNGLEVVVDNNKTKSSYYSPLIINGSPNCATHNNNNTNYPVSYV